MQEKNENQLGYSLISCSHIQEVPKLKGLVVPQDLEAPSENCYITFCKTEELKDFHHIKVQQTEMKIKFEKARSNKYL